MNARDHDPPAKIKMVPFGFLVLTSGALMLVFDLKETSDSWADALQLWWKHVRSRFSHIKRLVIDLDNGPQNNGPQNNGSRTQFLKRIIQFADWSGMEVRLIYYPTYHRKATGQEKHTSTQRQQVSVGFTRWRFVLVLSYIFSTARLSITPWNVAGPPWHASGMVSCSTLPNLSSAQCSEVDLRNRSYFCIQATSWLPRE